MLWESLCEPSCLSTPSPPEEEARRRFYCARSSGQREMKLAFVWSSRNRGIFRRLELVIRKGCGADVQRVAAGVPSANSWQTRISMEEGGGSKAPRAKWKRVSLSLSLSPCYVNTCVLLPSRTKGCASLTNITKVPRVDVGGGQWMDMANFEGIPRDCLGEHALDSRNNPDWRAFRNETEFRKVESNIP